MVADAAAWMQAADDDQAQPTADMVYHHCEWWNIGSVWDDRLFYKAYEKWCWATRTEYQVYTPASFLRQMTTGTRCSAMGSNGQAKSTCLRGPARLDYRPRRVVEISLQSR